MNKAMLNLFIGIIILFGILNFISSTEQESKTNSYEFSIGNNPIQLESKDTTCQEREEIINKEKTVTGVNCAFVGTSENMELSGEDFSVNNIARCDDEDKTKICGSATFDKSGELESLQYTSNNKAGEIKIDGVSYPIPANSKVRFDKEGGIKIDVPEGGEVDKLPNTAGENTNPNSEGTDLAQATKKYPVRISGKNAQLPGGNILQEGAIDIDENGEISVISGSTVNGISVNSNSGREKVFFDGQEHEGNYISFGEKNLISEGNVGDLGFKQENPYVKIEEGDYFSVTSSEDSKVEITNRDEEGKIPLVDVGGEAIIHEDGKEILFKEGGVYLNHIPEEYLLEEDQPKIVEDSTTSPIEINFAESKEFLDGKRLVVDNFNRIAYIDSSEGEGTFLNEGINSKISTDLSYNYLTEENMETLTGKKIDLLGIPEGNKQQVLGRLRDYWAELPEEAKEALGNINFKSGGYFMLHCGSNCGAWVGESTRALTLRDDSLMDYSTFRHEIAHLHQLKMGDNPVESEEFLKSEEFKTFSLKKEELDERGEELTRTNAGKEEFEKLDGEIQDFFSKYQESLKNFGFNNEWRKTAGDIYDKISTEKNGLWEYKEVPNSKEPRSGVIRPYGGSMIQEDVATFVEKINDPSFFAPLINPSSDKYDPRYRQKLDLLHEYKFISDSEYQNVLDAAGVK